MTKSTIEITLKWEKMGFLKSVPNFDSALIPDIFVKIYQNRVKMIALNAQPWVG